MKKDPALMLIVGTFAVAVIALVVLFLMGCDDGCEPEELRCRGQRSEICNASNEWEFIANCDAIEGDEGQEWVCCLGHNLWTGADEYACYLEEGCIE